MTQLTNETRTANRTFWFVANSNGRPVARLCKKNTGWNRWSVLSLAADEWKQFSNREDALAFASAL